MDHQVGVCCLVPLAFLKRFGHTTRERSIGIALCVQARKGKGAVAWNRHLDRQHYTSCVCWTGSIRPNMRSMHPQAAKLSGTRQIPSLPSVLSGWQPMRSRSGMMRRWICGCMGAFPSCPAKGWTGGGKPWQVRGTHPVGREEIGSHSGFGVEASVSSLPGGARGIGRQGEVACAGPASSEVGC
jgi:hypothetical protein